MINNKEKDIKDFNPADHILEISFLFFFFFICRGSPAEVDLLTEKQM